MTRKRVVGKIRHGLTHDVLWGLLQKTVVGHDRVFESDEDRRKAWIEFKDEVMAHPRNLCTRPDAWWCYEAPEQPWMCEDNCQALDRLGLLKPSEIEFLKELGRWPVKPCPGPDWDVRSVLEL
jgi:hypothetical protein